MSILVADSKSHHTSISQIPSSCPLSTPLHKADLRSCGSEINREEQDLFFDQNTLITYVYCFVKNFIGASGVSSVVVDKKIEQAMVLLKSHLMLTVRDEVEVLKDKISELNSRVSMLKHENAILRANASQETLSQIRGEQTIQSKQLHHVHHVTTGSLNYNR